MSRPRSPAPVGVVLAGGRGRRLGGAKALVELDGAPLITRPLAALRSVLDDVAVVAKADTVLPPLAPGIARWDEPDAPRHPLTGILHALRHADGRPVLVCATDLALLDAATLRLLLDAAAAAPAGALATVPRAGGRRQPLCALYAPAALAVLERGASGGRLLEAVAALAPHEVLFSDPRPFTNVNTPEDLAGLRARPPG